MEASHLIECDIDAGIDPEIDDEALEFPSGAAVGRSWPYWREFVRDASTRAGLPVIVMPFEVEE